MSLKPIELCIYLPETIEFTKRELNQHGFHKDNRCWLLLKNYSMLRYMWMGQNLLPVTTICGWINIHKPTIFRYLRYQGFDSSPYVKIFKWLIFCKGVETSVPLIRLCTWMVLDVHLTWKSGCKCLKTCPSYGLFPVIYISSWWFGTWILWLSIYW